MKIKLQKPVNSIQNIQTVTDFDIVKDVEFYLRLTYLESFIDFIVYRIDNSKGINDYSFLN